MLEMCVSSACLLALLSTATPQPLPETVSAASYIDEIDQLNGVEADLQHPGAWAAEPHAWFLLVPSMDPPYAPGAVIDVDLWIQNLDDTTRELRLVMFDTTDTDPAISLPASFSFDFNALSDQGDLYLQDERSSHPALAYTGFSATAGTMLELSAQGSLYVGTFRGVTLPTTPGTYRFDVLNADDSSSDHGAALRSGFGALEDDSLMRWRASSGEILGEPLALVVGGGACGTDAECDDGQFCNGRERCTTDGQCRAARRLPCAPQYCNENENVCRHDPSSYTRSAGDTGEGTRSAK